MTIQISNIIGDGQEVTTGHLPDPIEGRYLETIKGVRNRNQQRALFAGVGLKAYAERAGGTKTAAETVIGDLLADLRHLCDGLDLDFGSIDGQAYRRYNEEITGEG